MPSRQRIIIACPQEFLPPLMILSCTDFLYLLPFRLTLSMIRCTDLILPKLLA